MRTIKTKIQLGKNNQKIVVIFVMLLLVQFAVAQNNEWGWGFGSTNDENGQIVRISPTGFVYVAGTYQGTTNISTGSGTTTLTNNGGNDIFIAKFSSSGSLIWAKSISGNSSDGVYTLTIDASCNLYIGGYFQGTDVDFDPGTGQTLLSSTGTADMFFAKYDSSANLVWAKRMGGSGGCMLYCRSIAVYDGDVFITGDFYGDNIDFNPGTGTKLLSSGSASDAFVAKYDSDGNYIFAFNVGGSSSDGAQSMSLDDKGNIYITGQFFSSNAHFNPLNLASTINGSTGDLFIAKYDSSGKYIWAYGIGGSNWEYSYDIYVKKDYFYITGALYSTSVDFDPKAGTDIISSNSNGYSDIFFAKYDTSCTCIWARDIGGAGTLDDQGNSIRCDDLGNVYVTGYFRGTNISFDLTGNHKLTSNGIKDIFVAKYDKDANYIWANNYGSTGDDIAYSVDVDAKRNCYFTGNFKGSSVSFGYGADTTILSSVGSSDVFIAKYTDQADEISFSNVTSSSFTLSCNPGFGGKRAIFVREGTSGKASPIDKTSYPSNAVFGTAATQIGSTGWYCVYNGTSTSVNVTGITDGRTYIAMACEYTGTAGNEIYNTFASEENPTTQFVDFVAPTMQASSITKSNVTDTSATISWTNGNGTGRVVFMSRDASINPILINDSTYSGNSDYAIAANGSSGWVCVYNGTGSSVNLTGLSPNTQYYVRVFEYLGEPYRETFNVAGDNFSLKSKMTTIINFVNSIDAVYNNGDFSPEATTNSGNTLTYSSSDNSIATIVSSKIHILKTGSCKIYAYDSGNANFAIAKDSAVLTIAKAPLTISLKNSPVEKFYGDPDPAFEFFTSTMNSIDTITSISFNSDQTGDTGTFNINLSDAIFKIAGNASNYSINYISGKIKVKPAPLTITADEKTRTYGELNPVFTWKATGLKKSDIIEQVTMTCTATPRSDLGTYTISPSNLVFQTGKISNYIISYVNSNLTVVKSPIEICLVTIDMETGYSMVVWERNNSAGLTGYNVYRQNTEVGSYSKIGYVPISAIGLFVDSTSAIEKHAELYKITTINANSVESRQDQCNYHKSLFLQYAGTVGGVNLNWQPYEVENSGINFKSYVLYKGTDSTRLTVVDTVASNIYNYTDNDPQALKYKTYYRIAGLKYTACYPEGYRKAGAGPFSESISNLEDNRLRSTQGINKTVLKHTFDLVINPNPVKGVCAIRYNLPEESNVIAYVINMLGETVANIKVGIQQKGNTQFYLDANKLNLSNGLYLLKVKAGKYEATSKISVVR